MKTTIAVVGFGDRSEQYTKYVLKHPEEGEVTAVVDPNPARRGYAKRLFGLPEARCFRISIRLSPRADSPTARSTAPWTGCTSRLPCRSCGWGTTCCWKNRSRAIKRSSWRWKGRQRLADAG